jgi:formamidopyrimidine-DNA glycosylase
MNLSATRQFFTISVFQRFSVSAFQRFYLPMPELAEVEFFRKRWHLAAARERVVKVLTHDQKKLFRGTDAAELRHALTGATFVDSEARAKQMLFQFEHGSGRKRQKIWLGLHLGMTGELTVEPPTFAPGKHDHLVIVTAHHALVLNDPRMFGLVQFAVGPRAPEWWTRIAPAISSSQFTASAVGEFLARRKRAPIKAVLLMQERFPGIGNWMADEILWRAGIHPARPAGTLNGDEVKRLWRECRHVCRLALDAIAGRGRQLPKDLNVNIPRTWLFRHRWRRGGKDPISGTPLKHATIGGRTTCWSPARQK